MWWSPSAGRVRALMLEHTQGTRLMERSNVAKAIVWWEDEGKIYGPQKLSLLVIHPDRLEEYKGGWM